MSRKMSYDVFISHASEDKDAFVRELAQRLEVEGLSIWYDEFTLIPGSRLSESIDLGLSTSRFGLIVLSHHFFSKRWPKSELYSLISKENSLGESLLIPIWHNISPAEVAAYSPMLAERVAISSNQGLNDVVQKVLTVVRPDLIPPRKGIELRVAIAVVQHNNAFLLVKRRRPEGNLCWQFPAGVVKRWENEEDAAVRTVLNETGVSCDVIESLGERVHPLTLARLSYWICDYVSGDVMLVDDDENEAVAWMSPHEAISSITSDIFPPLRVFLVSKVDQSSSEE